MNEPRHIQLWNDCLAFIKDNLDEHIFNTWFKDIRSYGFEDGMLTLIVPSSFFVEQLEERFIGLLETAKNKIYGTDVQLFYRYYQVHNQPETAVNQLSTKPSPAILRGQSAQPANPFATEQPADIDSQLNPRYNFGNYCAGESNKIARAIGESIADNPNSHTFNPLFIFGPTGVGKTHLIQAIGIKLKERNPASRVLYVTARLFESQYTAAVANKNTNSFFHFYQSIDTLIVDDIQDLKGNKPATQNTFFHIFNHLHQNDKQIILSSDCAPAEMEGFEARLLSRFKWGMSVELEKPDLALRRSVLIQKARQNGIQLPDDVVEYIIQTVTDSIRDLEGIVVSLVAHATITGSDITLDLARCVLSRAVKIKTRQVNFEVIAQQVSAYYDIDPDLLYTKSRKREISDARQIVMFLAKKIAKMPIVTIGQKLDRTHATVNYACNTIQERLAFEKQLQTDIDQIQASILAF